MTAPKVVSLPRGVHLTLHQLAEEFGISRETVAKRLSAADIAPSGKLSGANVYRLRDAIAPILQIGDGKDDPEEMDPFRRHAYYKAEREARQLAVDDGRLIPADEVEAERARVLKVLTQGLETLPDLMERDFGLPAMVVVRVEEACDKQREAIYSALTVDEESPTEAPDQEAADAS